MNQLKRKVHRFRARIYARLPKNRSLLKGGILCMLVLGMMLYYKVKTAFPELFFKKETAVSASSGNASEGTEESTADKMSENDYKVPENGYLNVEYVQGSVTLTTPVPTKTPTLPPVESVSPGEGAEKTGEEEDTVETGAVVVTSFTGLTPAARPKLSDIIGKRYLLSNLNQLGYLKDTFYIVNQTTKMTETDFNAERFLKTDLSLKKKAGSPQILIYHTHASEAFIDSRSGVREDTVVGMGELLAEYLTEKYGYTVLHDTTVFDKKNGADNRSYAYNDALPYTEELLQQYPDIKVIIDLHRDAGAKRVATIQGKQVAKVMLFNGLCRNTSGELTHLPNKNLSSNLAFSFQMKLIGDEMYPGLMNRIFLKDYRYNMHLAERYLLIELGTENNTVEEASNAMEPLADVLAQVLGGV
ncbi:MAG: stage II sporulation protein P [Lachnospiraceae bacterium]